MHNYAILLAGGQGSRFWPQSRTLEPKQFLFLHQRSSSLFEETLKRTTALIPPANIFIVTLDLYRSQIHEAVVPYGIPAENIIFEPEPKNTAPCIAAAIRLISNLSADAKICIFPCDHMIRNHTRFLQLLKNAFKHAADNLIIFGIPPVRPATGYGYIKVKSRIQNPKSKINIFEVEKFIEKPNIKRANKIFKDGRYFWNSGIFLGSSRIFLEEIKKHLPALHRHLANVRHSEDLKEIWHRVEAISFDYGVLEKSKRLLMVKADNLGWSDLGSWQAWDEMLAKDKDGNSFIGDTINLNSRNITVLGNSRLISTIGLEDLIIVDTSDALLVTKKSQSEEVKKVVEVLKQHKRSEHYSHRTVRRPWGNYTVLEIANRFKIKLVEVKPRRSLSLQLHKKRSEHWVVVEGRAKVIHGKKIYFVDSNESTFIPLSCVHRLINPTDSVLKLVEVQTGGYLEEDDIVRLKDDFGRG